MVASVLVALPTPGQNGRLTFEGTSGQRISANATGCHLQWLLELRYLQTGRNATRQHLQLWWRGLRRAAASTCFRNLYAGC